MVRKLHQLNGCESEQTLEDSERQGSLACCSPWDQKELDTTEQLNNNSLGHSAAQLESGQNVFSIGF